MSSSRWDASSFGCRDIMVVVVARSIRDDDGDDDDDDDDNLHFGPPRARWGGGYATRAEARRTDATTDIIITTVVVVVFNIVPGLFFVLRKRCRRAWGPDIVRARRRHGGDRSGLYYYVCVVEVGVRNNAAPR